ncbi:MAG: hypothetical protein HYX40_05925 [Sphingobacteriales bacterium]|nr:hypothetical protein [Sphingobacteriales bacterium]
MRIILLFFLLFIELNTFSQDYFPDFRNKKEALLKVSQKDIRADIVTFALQGVEENIHQDPLPKLPLTGFDKTFMQFEGSDIRYLQFQNSTIKVKITTDAFDSTKNKISRITGHVVKINNRPFYGNYGNKPTTAIKEVLVIINKDTVAIPPVAYNDLFNIQFSYTDKAGIERSKNGVYLSDDKRKIYIYLLNKDSSGGYEVTWVIQDKQYLRRVLDYNILQ